MRDQAARIMIASADPEIHATATPPLSACGYDVFAVGSGPEVLLHTEEHAPDLYMLDHNLPEMDGLRVARHLRQSYGVPREHIVILYPAALPPSYQAEIQASEILITPFTGVELILCVMRHLGTAQAAAPEA